MSFECSAPRTRRGGEGSQSPTWIVQQPSQFKFLPLKKKYKETKRGTNLIVIGILIRLILHRFLLAITPTVRAGRPRARLASRSSSMSSAFVGRGCSRPSKQLFVDPTHRLRDEQNQSKTSINLRPLFVFFLHKGVKKDVRGKRCFERFLIDGFVRRKRAERQQKVGFDSRRNLHTSTDQSAVQKRQRRNSQIGKGKNREKKGGRYVDDPSELFRQPDPHVFRFSDLDIVTWDQVDHQRSQRSKKGAVSESTRCLSKKERKEKKELTSSHP